MQVLCNIQDSFVRGIVSVFEAIPGLNLTVYDNSIPVFDIFDEVKPDLFITKNNLLDRATLKYLLQNPDIKTCIINTESRNFYGRELEKNGRIDYTLKDEPAADLMTFKDCNGEIEGDDYFTLVVTDFLSGDGFLEMCKWLTTHDDGYKVFGNKIINHPSYVGQLEYQDVAKWMKKAHWVHCEPDTDWALNAIVNDKDEYTFADRQLTKPTKEDILNRLNYNYKLSTIFNATGFPDEGEECLRILNLQ
jgi:hypothetical protein